MTTTLELKTNDFKNILKSFGKFSQHSHKKPSISITFDPVRLVMVTDHAYISAKPIESIATGDLIDYSLNPEVLMGLTLRSDTVSLSWEDENSLLSLKNGHLDTKLRVSTPQPEFTALPRSIDNIEEIPVGVLVAITKFLSIPFSFDTRKKELMPVRLYKSREGCLVASADDGYSLAKINTNLPITAENFDIKVPKYIFDCLYSKGSMTELTFVDIGIKGNQSLFSNDTIQIFSSGMTDKSSDFDMVIADFKPFTSFSFKPKTLAEAIKPLVDLIPKKDRGGTVVNVAISDKMSMSVSHQDVGEGKVDEVEDIEEIYNEASERKASVFMHPQSFQDYTNLFTVEKGTMLANNRMVYYKGTFNTGSVSLNLNYLFPTVQV